MTTLEKDKLKLKLTETMSAFIEKVTLNDNEIGLIPDDLDALMSDAAFAVLQAVTATNEYLEEQDMLK